MEIERLKAIIESLLLASGEPLSWARMVAALEDFPTSELRAALNALLEDYAPGRRGIVIEEVAGGYQLRSARENASYVRRLFAGRMPRLTRPMLETIAVVAYRQPVTRAEIEALRGVDSGAVLDSLIAKSLIKVVGRKEAPGRPLLYGTTRQFLEFFSLRSLDDLPDLEELSELQRSEGVVASPEAGPASGAGLGEESDAGAEETNSEPTAEPLEGEAREPSDGASAINHKDSLPEHTDDATRANGDLQATRRGSSGS